MASFTEFFTKLRDDLDEAHQARRQFCRDTQAEVQQAADRLRQDLAEFAADLRAAGKAFRHGHQSGLPHHLPTATKHAHKERHDANDRPRKRPHPAHRV